MGIIAETIGRRLKTLRGEIPQTEIARRADMHVVQYGKYERGQQSPGDDALERIAEALGCSVETLIGSSEFFLASLINKIGQYRETARSVGINLRGLRATGPGRAKIERLTKDGALNLARLAQIEMGRTLPEPVEAELLCEALGCDLQRLLLDVEGWRASFPLNRLVDELVQHEFLGRDLSWIDAEPLEPGVPLAKDAALPVMDEYVFIPLYDLQAAAGHGVLVEENQRPKKHLAFLKAWVKAERGLHVPHLVLVTVVGDSMEPTLREGDVVLVDRSRVANYDDGLYVLRIDGAMLVKRLHRLPERRVQVTSDNAVYRPFELDLAAPPDDMEIIGRVVWVGRDM